MEPLSPHPLTERIVRLVAPRGRLDLAVKAAALLLFIGVLNWQRDVWINGPEQDGFLNNFLESTWIAAPFIVGGLALIGHLARLQRDLARLATTDMLTGLPNRRSFFEEADSGDPVVVFMVDIDHFKSINDAYGHKVGDDCLRATADRLRMLKSAGHAVARIGGEEFAIVLRGVDRDEAMRIGDGLAEGLEVGIGAEQRPIRMTFSVGAACRRTSPSLDETLHRADVALYHAKRSGRARLCFWRPLGADPSEPDITQAPPPAAPDPEDLRFREGRRDGVAA